MRGAPWWANTRSVNTRTSASREVVACFGCIAITRVGMSCPASWIWVRTRCVERGWHGGCEQSASTCSQSQVNQIINALNDICDKVQNCDLKGLQILKNCISRASDEVVWKCASLSSGAIAQASGKEVTLTPAAFSSSSQRFRAIVFHEIIHTCGGTELDSEAFENHCYRNSGATAPTSDDFPKFRNDGARWVNWNGATGSVTTKSGQSLNVNTSAFVDPEVHREVEVAVGGSEASLLGRGSTPSRPLLD